MKYLVLLFSLAAQAASVSVQLQVAESKEVYTSYVRGFKAFVQGKELSCINHWYAGPRFKNRKDFNLETNEYDWNKKVAKEHQEAVLATEEEFHLHTSHLEISHCRDADTQMFLSPTLRWDAVQDDFDIKKEPVSLVVNEIGSNEVSNYSCNNLEKEKYKETDKFNFFNLKVKCQKSKTSKYQTIVYYLKNMGIYNATNSYENGIQNPVKQTAESLGKAADNFFSTVAEGTYKGVKKTLSKKCELEMSYNNDKFTIVSSYFRGTKKSSRTLEFGPQDILGTSSGTLYKDLHGFKGKEVGQFQAIQFKIPNKSKNNIVTLRAEDRTDKDAKVVRILSNSIDYCRRLLKK